MAVQRHRCHTDGPDLLDPEFVGARQYGQWETGRTSSAILTARSQTPNQWFNTAAFAAQPLYVIGNLGRNTMFGPPMKNLDFSAFKDFPIRERSTLQFRAELFNILNHPNLGQPATSLGASNFGVISDTGNYLPRNIQLALKLEF